MASTSNLPTANNSFRIEEDKDRLNEDYNDADFIPRKVSCNSDYHNRKIEISEQSTENILSSDFLNKRKLSEDFKTKFKTELCKFWELNGECKFGENVR